MAVNKDANSMAAYSLSEILGEEDYLKIVSSVTKDETTKRQELQQVFDAHSLDLEVTLGISSPEELCTYFQQELSKTKGTERKNSKCQ